jgi:hypothetical protein
MSPETRAALSWLLFYAAVLSVAFLDLTLWRPN